jgi:acyl-coenzyme A synthetase/AMP-(fatty) acid ligase
VDTWWQTETGAAMICPLPHAWDTKPGSATLPFFGVEPVLLDDKGRELAGASELGVWGGRGGQRRTWGGVWQGKGGGTEELRQRGWRGTLPVCSLLWL